MGRTTWLRASIGLLVVVVAATLLPGCGGTQGIRTDSDSTVFLSTRGTSTLLPQTVNPDDLRWRDIADQTYTEAFQGIFDYFDTGTSYVTVDWNDSAPTLSGTLTAVKLKPNFAYQMKLEGKAPIDNARRPPNPSKNPEGWASWQLGHVGRWWCETDGWNVSDSELNSHVRRGHSVIGYLLFDYFVTDEHGNVTKIFALDSSYHVLWKVSQRAPGANDSTPTSHTVVMTSAWGYDVDETDGTVEIYAEWEPNRPLPGEVTLPAGTYPVSFNITEESFHANLTYDQPLGGFWAQVLKGDVTFVVSGGGEPSGTGSIQGTVTDATGSPARKALVTLTDDSGQEPSRTTQTKGRGQYSFDDVPAGASRYTVTATKDGKSASQSGVSVQDGVATVVDLQLQ
ncbi:MAG: carboxypeptidase-like regulatory domain-containing protein [Armatimonadota bacterium]